VTKVQRNIENLKVGRKKRSPKKYGLKEQEKGEN